MPVLPETAQRTSPPDAAVNHGCSDWVSDTPLLPDLTWERIAGAAARLDLPAVSADATNSVLLEPLFHPSSPARNSPVIVTDSPTVTIDQSPIQEWLASHPDWCAVVGPPGTGKSQILGQHAVACLARGEKILIVSPHPDRWARNLRTASPDTEFRRVQAPGETIDAVPIDLRSAIPAVRNEQILRAVSLRIRELAEYLEARLETLGRAESAVADWESAAAIQHQTAEFRRSIAETIEKRDRISEPSPDDTEFAHAVETTVQERMRHESALAALIETRSTLESLIAEKEARSAQATENQQVVSAGKWWTSSYWKARKLAEPQTADLLNEELTRLREDHRSQTTEIERCRSAITELTHSADSARRQAIERSRKTWDDHIQADSERLAQRESTRQDLQRTAQADWSALPIGIAWEQVEADPSAVRVQIAGERRQAWERTEQLRRLKSDPQRSAELLGPVVRWAVASFPALLNEHNSEISTFDRVIVDDAHRADSEQWRRLLTSAPHGTAAGSADPSPFLDWAKQAERSDCYRDGDRHFISLHPHAQNWSTWETEPVTDRPEILLHIDPCGPNGPIIAAVSVPREYSVASLKEFLAAELDTVRLRPVLWQSQWEETESTVHVAFGRAAESVGRAKIGNGVTEELDGDETVGIRFERSEGWTRESAERWVTDQLLQSVPLRVYHTTEPKRNCRGLAIWLEKAFQLGFVWPANGPFIDSTPHVSFLAVPDVPGRPTDDGYRGGGAGYEIDLADQRRALPLGFEGMAHQGVVNIPEATALIRYLCDHHDQFDSIVVTAPCPAQVEVLRRLARKLSAPLSIAVRSADDLSNGEWDLVAVSLTRSHVSRAVHFGDSADSIRDLCLHARRRVLFAGDPGTLTRRLQWRGALAPWSLAETERENRWLVALSDCPRVNVPRQRR